VTSSGAETFENRFWYDVRSTLAGLGLATAPLVFSYIKMLRQAGPQRWVFDELAATAEQRFRFAEDEEASEYVSRLAASLPLYAPEHALNGPHVHEEWRPDLVSSCICSKSGRVKSKQHLQWDCSALSDVCEWHVQQKCSSALFYSSQTLPAHLVR